MSHVVQHIGCVPEYWRRFIDNKEMNPCNSSLQYRNFSEYIPRMERKQVYKIFGIYKPPCNRMRIVTNVKFLNYYQEDKIKIDFRYLTNEYEEIQNVKDFGLESLVANIGGYVGMFLGFSLLQFSSLLIAMFQNVREACVSQTYEV